MNNNTPFIPVLVRPEYLGLPKDSTPTFGYLYGVFCDGDQVPLFHVFLETGATFHRLPPSAFQYNPNPEVRTINLEKSLNDTVRWNSLSTKPHIVTYDLLKGRSALVVRYNVWTTYFFSIEFEPSGNDYTTIPGEYKVAHVLVDGDGCFWLQPNNSLRWADSALKIDVKEPVKYKIQRQLYYTESKPTLTNGEEWSYDEKV